jgi:hypothetical protein
VAESVVALGQNIGSGWVLWFQVMIIEGFRNLGIEELGC